MRTCRQPGGNGRQPMGPHSTCAPGARDVSGAALLDEIAPACAGAGGAIAASNTRLQNETAKRAIDRAMSFPDISSRS
jgi:hypothetical protein